MAHILVVDDAPDLRLLMRLTLEGAGHQVTEADGGTNVMPTLQRITDIDLIILDVQMPVVDGWQVLSEVKADPTTADVPVLMCTVKFSHEDLIRAWTAGIDDFLNKPFDLSDMIAMAGELIQMPLAERQQRRADEIASLHQAASGTRT